jgi:hypothetical protein
MLEAITESLIDNLSQLRGLPIFSSARFGILCGMILATANS